MTKKSNSFSTGAGGANFEQKVQAAFLTTMIVRGAIPCFEEGFITKINLQSSSTLEYSTDDFYAEINSNGDNCRLLAQIKHNITISDNEDFDKVTNALWKDFVDSNQFNPEKDKFTLIKGGLNDTERNHIVTLLGWAKSKDTSVDFYNQVEGSKAKEDKLQIFSKSLGKAKGGTVTKEELWKFLKCFYLIGYDFTNDASINEAGLVSLINLAINKTDTITAKQVWNDILASIIDRNPTAGSYTIDGIRKLSFYKYFNLNNLETSYKALKKLKDDSNLVLNPLTNTIGGIHLDRVEIKQTIIEAIKHSQFIIITGEAGVGKSAIVKDVLLNDLYNIQKFAFKADQFSCSNLAQVFSNIGIHENLKNLFACLTLTTEKILLIDSLEKLLESDSDNAFMQLLSIISGVKDIKVICTCRQYAVELLTKKYGINQQTVAVVAVPILSDNETSIITTAFSGILPLLENKAIAKLLKTPKYLDYSISLIKTGGFNNTHISIIQFKSSLWSHVVEKSSDTRNGLPLKRNNAFYNIALNRAKKMTLFVSAENCDSEALIALEKDGVIIKENNRWHYSPSHDLLEDWALVKYVQEVFENCAFPESLFLLLGNEPAIRRAFRLWVQDYLLDDFDKIEQLVKAALDNPQIERYWADEILIVILKSIDSSRFFAAFETHLLAEKGLLLVRCIHLLNTACKETNSFNTEWKISMPVGSGWTQTILLIEKHIRRLDSKRNVILSFLQSWYSQVLFKNEEIDNDVMQATKSIALFYLGQCEEKDSFWKVGKHESNIDVLIGIVFSLASICTQEIEELVGRASNYDRRKDDWELHSFYDKIIDEFLTGVGNQNLAQAVPDLIIKVAKKKWIYKEPEEQDDFYSSRPYLSRDNFHREELRWGLNDKMDFFPSGIFKVPVYNLLNFHPFKAIEFICDILNYSIDFYSKSTSQYKQPMQQIEIRLNDGKNVKQWGNDQLWCAYRGTSVSHDLIESILMSLEKYLLEVAKNNKFGKTLLRYHTNYLLSNSNNVSTTSVLCSVIMAYPEQLDEPFLPIISVPEFYDFDLSRVLSEFQALAPADMKLLAAQKERFASNSLPHRKKYSYGLKSFVIEYQFRIGTLNTLLFESLDRLKEKVQGNVLLEKWLMEIDTRKWVINKTETTDNRIIIQPGYSENVQAFVEKNSNDSQSMLTSMQWASMLSEASQKNESLSLEDWQNCFIKYTTPSLIDNLYDKPVTLSIMGLTFFKDKLNQEQRKWCFKTVTETIAIILKNIFSQSFTLEAGFNIMEKQIALQSFSILFENANCIEELTNTKQLFLYTLIAPFIDHDLDEFIKYVQQRLNRTHPNEVTWAWKRLILYTQFLNNNPRPWSESDSYTDAITKEDNFLKELIRLEEVQVDIALVEFNIDRADLLLRAFTIIPWEIEMNSVQHQFCLRFINFLSTDLQKEYDYERIRNRNRKLSFRVLPAQLHTANVLLYSNINVAKQIIDELIKPFLNGDYKPNRSDRDYFDYVKNSFEYVLYYVVDLTDTPEKLPLHEDTIKRLWEVMDYLNGKIPQMTIPWFRSIVLLDLNHMDTLKWMPLNSRRRVYFELAEKYWDSHYKTVIKVFSTFGSDAFLPEGLSLIKKLTEKNEMELTQISSIQHAHKLVEAIYYGHLKEIKQSKTFINDYIWLLDIMVEAGSSDAYLYRENVITYKSPIGERV